MKKKKLEETNAKNELKAKHDKKMGNKDVKKKWRCRLTRSTTHLTNADFVPYYGPTMALVRTVLWENSPGGVL